MTPENAREIAKDLVAAAHYGVMTNEQLEDRITEALLSAGERRGAGFRFDTPSLRARGVGRVGDEPRALLVLLTDIPGDDDIRALHDWLVQ